MNGGLYRLRAGELRKIAGARDRSVQPSFLPSNYWHIYIKLDFQKRYENAETKSDGKSFVRNVARAARATEVAVTTDDGIVVEVQGSVIHCILPDSSNDTALVRKNCRAINNALHLIFPDSSRVEGWRMAADWGKTLLVVGQGIHDDNSFVSLGNSANAPAKYLFAQLALSEDARQLKRYMLAWRTNSTATWTHDFLGRQVDEEFHKSAAETYEEIRGRDFGLTSFLTKQARAAAEVHAKAAPLGPGGIPTVPISDEPTTYFGWVMRADIDGFTARVESCFDDDGALLQLGQQFLTIMQTAARFAAEHDEVLVQLPWAGDNFTAAVVYGDRNKYEEAVEQKLIEFSLDFASALRSVVIESGLGGWAQTVAGGVPDSRSLGNIYIGSVEFENRRFLIGTGVGIGRTTQAFTDMDPKPDEIVVYEPDVTVLLKPYQDELCNRKKPDGTDSTLFRKATVNALATARRKITSNLSSVREPAKTAITFGTSSRVIASSRDYGENPNRLL
jgi:hypothetical protein